MRVGVEPRIIYLFCDIFFDTPRLHGRLHSPRTERMTEKSPVTPIAISVHTKKKAPLVWPMLLVTPTPFPLMWARGTTNEKSPPRRVMMYPDRRSASTSVPYSQKTKMGTALRFVSFPGSNPRTMSSARRNVKKRMEGTEGMVRRRRGLVC